MNRTVVPEGRRVLAISFSVLGAIGLVLPYTLASGWPQVGFEGALVLSGLAHVGGMFFTLFGAVIALVDGKARGWSVGAKCLIVVYAVVAIGYMAKVVFD